MESEPSTSSMPSEPSSSKIASTLTIKNLRLPPHAYAGLNHIHLPDDHQTLPLVDLDYVHFETSSSSPTTNIVEVRLQPSSSTSTSPPFERFHPFASTSREIAPRLITELETPPPTTQVLGQFTIPTLPYTQPHTNSAFDARGSLAIPGGLCHPHIHLDKAYLLDRCTLSTGTFDEALSSTADAKAKFTPDDVRQRMRRLVASSVSHGVTTMRAFVEVDPTVGLMCLEAAVEVKKEYETSCEVQIVAFAQDAVFYPDDEEKQREMQALMEQAASREEVDVVGSAPYVEALSKTDAQLPERERKVKQKGQQAKNIDWIFDLAKRHGKHVDFHLDYDLDPPGPVEEGEQSMIPYVVSVSRSHLWDHRSGHKRSITLGHCTKLSCFTEQDLAHLASCFGSSTGPPISFVSLPPSDLYMQGRTQPYATRSRATLPLLSLASRPDLREHTNWAMGVNNVCNLFTPQGDADPLALLPTMVGVWQSAKPEDCEVLLGSVSTRARIAAGLDEMWRDLTVIDGTVSVQGLVCAPSFGRLTIKNGRLVGRRRVVSEVFPLLMEAEGR
ncbi:hypothetical protein PSEUBRA_003625 [Kalmanozyma brasiliensis GHG001]|uniref:Metallo-dependent hydrolase n=1 Tax=Kalmanozyma brasiliensis (strain GHG001) TaxID=1365824 RepID=V5EPF9_KALBG|nr:uncharacterized protein PSEUBRA_003625 [Kalmanozyma brasiliensis GHG001]EST06995.1 hypothetical protein PSEUBRA_003625 [Kalmanozyma brasiliensis GHG001]